MLYLYAIVPRRAKAPAQAGIEDRPVGLVPIEGVAAVVGEVTGPVDPSEEHVLAHARVVDELVATNAAVLPARFGRGFDGPDELAAAIAPLAPRLEARLCSVRGCVEIGLHVVAEREPAGRIESGRDYMQRRARERAREEAVADAIHAPLAERARAASRSAGAGVSALLRAAYLVPRDDVDGFRTFVVDVGKGYSALSFSCTGPWPPYSFATLEAAA